MKLREIVIACKEYLSQRIDDIIELTEAMSLLENFAEKLSSNDDSECELEREQAMLSIGERLVRSRAKAARNKTNSTNDTKLSKDVVGFFEALFRFVVLFVS